ncbi:MAG TPA: arylsulfatase [Lachnospiraceae bacterium]|nr:arylsulfatase [Lachnospiraceae bacterium]
MNAEKKEKVNVLILLSDQQRYDTVHAAGFPHMKTPNLDRLASEGVLFEQCHSSNPVCMACRHDLLTGRPGRDHGYYTNLEEKPIDHYGTPTLPRIFSESGYRTAAIGKMHFYPVREHHGFGEMYLMEELPKRRQDDQYAEYLKERGLADIQNQHGVRPLLYHTPQNSAQSLNDHGSMWVADRSVQWLRENREEPFFLMCGFIQPHPPWNIPKELDGLYQNTIIPDPVRISRMPMDGNEKNIWFGDYDSKEQKDAIRKAYFTAVSMVDMAVGKILDELERSGRLDHTLVIFTSDHGEMLQDKGYYSKELAYEGSVRIPLIVRLKGQLAGGRHVTGFVDTFDILPTCLDACGLVYPAGETRGKSLLKLAKQNDRKLQYSSSGLGYRRWVMCRNERFKYVYHYNGGYEELFDMRDAEGELYNLFETQPEKARAAADDLRKEALRYEEECGPVGYIQGGSFCPVPYKPYHGSIRGKYHFWANGQMQNYYEGNRAERLIQEILSAVSDRNKSGAGLKELCKADIWKKDFMERFAQYTARTLTLGEEEKLFGELFSEDVRKGAEKYYW